MARPTETIESKFWKHVQKSEGCWMWQGCIDPGTGYGAIGIDHKTKGAHRVSWELHFGKIPQGLCVCHRCDVPACVNPMHLFLDTRQGNLEDMVSKNRQAKGSKVFGSKLTEFEVRHAFLLHRKLKWTKVKIATVLGITPTAVAYILSGRTWAWLSEATVGAYPGPK